MLKTIPRELTTPVFSFFLFGPRGVGKSTWLKKHFGEGLYIDLLKSTNYLKLAQDPSHLEKLTGHLKEESWVCIDEIQKIPALLDEVQSLMEDKKLNFALSGSSARKLKRGGANLLAGRAITKTLSPFCYAELKDNYNLDLALEWGLLPLVVTRPQIAKETLRAYVHTYLKEEIKEEGIVRKVEPFIRFLKVAGIMNGAQLNLNSISRDAHVHRTTVETYLNILEETLLATRLPAYKPNIKVREHAAPKLYWFDPGVVRATIGMLDDPVRNDWRGLALETLILHELNVYNHTRDKNRGIYYYHTGSAGSEIDFVIETKKQTQNQPAEIICLEVKHTKNWRSEYEKPCRNLQSTGKINIKKMIGIYRGNEVLNYNNFEVLPVMTFLKKLYAGDLF